MYCLNKQNEKSSKKSLIKKYFHKLSENSLKIKKYSYKPQMPQRKTETRRPGIFARSFPINLQQIVDRKSIAPQSKSFKARLNNNLTFLLNKKSTNDPVQNILKLQFYNELDASPPRPNIELQVDKIIPNMPPTNQTFNSISLSSMLLDNASFKNVITSTPYPTEYRLCEPVILNRTQVISKKQQPDATKCIKKYHELCEAVLRLAKATNKRIPKYDISKSCLERLSRYKNSLKITVPETPVGRVKHIDLKTPLLEYIPPLDFSLCINSPATDYMFEAPEINRTNSWPKILDSDNFFDSPNNVSDFLKFRAGRQKKRNIFEFEVRILLIIF